MLTPQEINDRVDYHPPGEAAKKRHEAIRLGVAKLMLSIGALVPEGREQSIAITKIEEAMFWANAGVARNHALIDVLDA